MKIKKKYEMPTLEVVECYGNMALCTGSVELTDGQSQKNDSHMGDSVW